MMDIDESILSMCLNFIVNLAVGAFAERIPDFVLAAGYTCFLFDHATVRSKLTLQLSF